MIKVNEYTISEKEFDLACEDYKRRTNTPTLPENVVRGLATQLIEAKLLLEESKRVNVEISPEELDAALNNIKKYYKTEAEFEQALKQFGDTEDALKGRMMDNLMLQKYINDHFLAVTVVSDQDAEKYYKANEDKFVAQDQVKASHILIKEEAEAKRVKQLLTDGADFAEMAKEYSTCPSASNGGDLGLFGKGQMVPEFEKAAFESEVNEITDLVKTQFGYHIIKVVEKVKGGQQEFETVKEQLKEQIKNAAVNNNIQKFVQTLKQTAKITVNEELLKSKIG